MLLEQIELEQDEQIITMIRKHWFILFAELFTTALTALLPILLLSLYPILPKGEMLPETLSGYYTSIIISLCIWLTLCIMAGTMAWTYYYLNLWVLTNKRVILVQQLGFFRRKVSSFRLERLQDVKVKVTGFIATILNFGTIRAQTAGAAEDNFRGSGLPDPRGFQAKIQKATDERIKTLYNTKHHLASQ